MRYGAFLKVIEKAGFTKTETEDHLMFRGKKNSIIMLPLVDGRKKVSDMHLHTVRYQLKMLGKKNYKDIKLTEE